MPDAVPWFGACLACGGEGRHLPVASAYCPSCRWLRPLGDGYRIPVEAFMWSLDAQAMSVLRSIAPLNGAAQALSNRIGRPWFEATVNGIRLGPDQLPDIFEPAILAARILGLPVMPEVYISGEAMWEAQTLGSDTSAFISIGSILSTMKGEDLLFVLGREMGHCAAHHALWQTVLQFMSGKKQMNHTLMGQGVLQFLNPAKLIESAIDTPLLAWARHAEITADRAGALVVRDFDVVRRVSTQWTVRSFPLYGRLNLEALERQVAEADDRALQIAEWAMTSKPYLSRRLRVLNEYARSEIYLSWKRIIDYWLEKEESAASPTEPPPAVTPPQPAPTSPPPPTPDSGFFRVTCPECGEGLKFRESDFSENGLARIKCLNTACGKTLEVQRKGPRPADDEKPRRPGGSIGVICVTCGQAIRVARADLEPDGPTRVRCANPSCRAILIVTRTPPQDTPVEATTPGPYTNPPHPSGHHHHTT